MLARRPSVKRVHVVAAIWIAVVAGILFPALTGSRVFLGTDLLEAFAPWSSSAPDNVAITNGLVGDTVDGAATPLLFQDRLRDGDPAPLWDGTVLGGRPLAPGPNAGIYSPLNVGYWFLPDWYAPGFTKLLELAIASGFMFLLLRRFDLSRSASLLGGLIYAFSGFQVVWTNWPQAHIGALVPALFWAIDRAVTRRTAVAAIPVAAVSAVMWVEGFPAITVYALAFGGVFALVRSGALRRAAGAWRGLRTSAGGVIGGLALAAFQLLPFVYFLGDVDRSSRAQLSNWSLPRRALATLAVPDAFGSPIDGYYGPSDYQIYGPINYVEIQAFIGIAALACIAVAAVYGARLVGRPVVSFLWGGVAACAALMYFSGPLLDLYHDLPLIGTNYIGRLRVVFLFLLAVLAAIGFEALVRRLPSRASPVARWGLVAAVGAVGVVVGFGLLRARDMAEAAGRLDFFGDEMVVAAVIGTVVAAGVATAHLRGRAAPRVALWVIPLMVAFEIFRLAAPYWPQVPREQFYPVTDSHRFVQDNVGDGRLAAANRAFLPSTTSHYGIRSVTGHAFTPRPWAEALEAVDPGAFRFSATFSTLEVSPGIANSPVLDRMGASLFAAPPESGILGSGATALDVPAATLEPGDEVVVPVTAPVAGVVISLPGGHASGAEIDSIVVAVRDDGGGELASGERRLARPVAPGVIEVAVPSEPGGSQLAISVQGDDAITLGLAGVIAARSDLPVAYAGGAVVYERPNALPRIRWSPRVWVIVDEVERLSLLSAGVPHDIAILSEGPAAGEGGAATIDVIEDDAADVIRVAVSAEGPGYLVIADDLRSWKASVDGEPADIVEADHIGGAVAVEAGDHVVELRVDAAGWRVGLVISTVAAAALIVVGLRARSGRDDRPYGGAVEAEPPGGETG